MIRYVRAGQDSNLDCLRKARRLDLATRPSSICPFFFHIVSEWKSYFVIPLQGRFSDLIFDCKVILGSDTVHADVNLSLGC